MVLETILSSEFAVRIIYPFLLVFVLIFAILEKSKILGEDKRQIDALIALSIALITIAFSSATDVIINLMPFLAISAVILLVFMILYGFVASTGDKGLELSDRVKNGFFVLAAIAVIIAVIVATGQWPLVYSWLFVSYGSGPIWGNILLIAIIVGAMWMVMKAGKSSSDS